MIRRSLSKVSLQTICVGCFFLDVCSCCSKKWIYFVSICCMCKGLNLFQPKIYQRGRLLGICIGCIVAKTNIHDCNVGYNIPTCFRYLCKMLDTMFQHPDTIQCAQIYAYLYARLILFGNPHLHILLSKLRVYLFRISSTNVPKGVTYLRNIWRCLEVPKDVPTYQDFPFCY